MACMHTKYQRPGPSGFRQEDFLSFELNLVLAPVTKMDWNGLSNFSRRSPKEHFCEIILKSVQQFWRSCLKQKLTMQGHTDGRQTKTDHNTSP